MIHAIRCDRPSFKEVEFGAGFNVVLADRTKESTKKDTRNGLGKSTLIEIIHFCLGAKATKGKGLLVEPLNGWSFILDMTIANESISVARNTNTPSKIFIEGNTANWPIKPRRDQRTGRFVYGKEEWRIVLGALMFGLSDNIENMRYTPTFRSLISYFIRRGRDAFSTPFEHYRKQHEWDKQINNAFLLGLSWEDASEWQVLKEKEQLLGNLKAAAQAGLMKEMLGSLGELEATKVRLTEKVLREEESLRTFRVYPQYRELEKQANLLTEEIHQLANDNVADGQLLALPSVSIMLRHLPYDKLE